MSDPIPVRISQLPATTAINDGDDIVLVQSGATVRTTLASIDFQTSPADGDDYLILRSNRLFKIDSSNLPVRGFVGQLLYIPGNVQNPSTNFPNVCLTNFENSVGISETNYPDLVPWLRGQQVIYLEGQTGQVSQFPCTVAGSEITLSTTTANDNLLAALNEDSQSFGGVFVNWRTVDIDGTTFIITGINTGTRVITVTGSPSTGSQNAIFYPHRIAGSTTSARIFSYRGRSPVGAGIEETISGLTRRDQLQGHWHSINRAAGDTVTLLEQFNAGGGSANVIAGGAGVSVGNVQIVSPMSDGVNGTPRVGSTTHGRDFGAHIYMYGGRYVQ